MLRYRPNVRHFIAVLGMLLAIVQYQLWLAPSGYRTTHILQSRIAKQQKRNDAYLAKNNQLTVEIQHLRHGGQAVEEYAREDLGMVKDGEAYYALQDA